jgi:putative PEP-CTERM system histidine kinase
MENYSLYSYLSATAGYSILLVLILIRINKDPVNICFALAISGSLAWTGLTTYSLQNPAIFISETLPLETLNYTLWFVFLIVLLIRQQYNNNYALLIKSWQVYLLLAVIALIFLLEFFINFYAFVRQFIDYDPRFFSHNCLAITGLILIEYLYKNADTSQKSAIKFICFGLGCLFLFDFVLFSKSLLYTELDFGLWNSRGFIHLLLMPFLAVSIKRLQQKSTATEIPISRQILFPTAILFSTGIYLVLMSLAGYYIKDSGGDLGQAVLPIFIFLTILLFLLLAFSQKIRTKVRINFTKHFFQYNYDYREQWLKLSKSLTKLNTQNELLSLIIKTMAGLVDGFGGGLWLKNDQGNYYLAKYDSLGFHALQIIDSDDPVIQFLINKKWTIDFVEYNNNPQKYTELDLSQWFAETSDVWLIIPLFKQNEMLAFVVISKAIVPRQLNWEDHDILKTVAMQLSNALALSHASDELSRSRQFEAYNQLSAYLVHDLKNLVTQVSLIVKNAETYKHNPEFIDDSIDTLKNVSGKLQHLVGQLKKEQLNAADPETVDLLKVIADIAIQQAGNKPKLSVATQTETCLVKGANAKMTAILGHLVQNAQEATKDNGLVKLELFKNKQQAIIKIIDNGIGMDSTFISERLFKPFDTTKGNAGMGIGVYEARDYILKQSGQINVKSAPGQGTTFIISLPLI